MKVPHTPRQTAQTSLWAQKVAKENAKESERRMPSQKAVKLHIYLIAHCQDFIRPMKGAIHQQGWSLPGSILKASLAESCTSYSCSQRSGAHITIKGRRLQNDHSSQTLEGSGKQVLPCRSELVFFQLLYLIFIHTGNGARYLVTTFIGTQLLPL